MNAFANTLFTLLLGWLKVPAQWMMNFVESGSASSFSVWLGDHWLLLAVLMCLLGTAVDIAVWLLRWQPQLAWRTRWRHFVARANGTEMKNSERRNFDRGYSRAVVFSRQDDGNEHAFAVPEPYGPANEGGRLFKEEQPENGQPMYQTEGSGYMPQQPVYGISKPAYIPQETVDQLQQEIRYREPEPEFAPPEEAEPNTGRTVRRRRSDRYRQDIQNGNGNDA